jgi:3-dehydroquinate dehydratase-2
MGQNTKIVIINGPNLNLLGKREPEHYGDKTLDEIRVACDNVAREYSIGIDFFQSNDESEIIDLIQSTAENHGIIINAGAYTHTSIAIHDALKTSKSPSIEVHLSNIHKREEFRHKSFLSNVVNGIIIGLSDHGYELAVHAMAKLLRISKNNG